MWAAATKSSFSSNPLGQGVPPPWLLVGIAWEALKYPEVPGPNADYFHLSLRAGLGGGLRGIGSFFMLPQAIPACRQVGEMVLLDQPSAATVKSIWGAVTLFSA